MLDKAEGRLKTIRAAFFILRTGANLDSEITNLKSMFYELPNGVALSCVYNYIIYPLRQIAYAVRSL